MESEEIRQFHRPGSEEVNRKVALWKGSITNLKIGAVVNAANAQLLPGGGVCGAIHSAAGPMLAQACQEYGPGCEEGQTVLTPGFNLPAEYVLHTVGPTDQNPKVLRSAYRTVLDLAVQNNIRSVAFCCVGTGIYGFPGEEATHIALSTVRDWLDRRSQDMDLVVFVMFADDELRRYQRLMPQYFPPPPVADAMPETADMVPASVPEKEEPLLCVACHASPRTHVFAPCGHAALCASCAEEHMKQDDLLCCPRCDTSATFLMRLIP
mmetsp:Transcript_58079/g.104650  ORF Transcript_58079/g.104650 Transcript_58079/m.104650 type:complete len:266 (+) Transcript_58079:64-861(+)